MLVQTFTLGELQTNCYLLINQNAKQCVIIDPADDANFLSEQILRQNLKLMAILATHGHFDHILAASELQMAFSPLRSSEGAKGGGVPFYIHEKDLFLVKNLTNNASFWTKRRIVERPPSQISFLSPDSPFAIYHLPFTIIFTPGHTPGSICFYFSKEKILFTGDTLFSNGVGRTDFSYSSKKDLAISLEKLAQLPPETKIYPGHGEASTIQKSL